MLSVCLLQDKCYLLHFELTPLFGMGYSTKPCTGIITYQNEMCHSPIKMTMIFSNSHLTWNPPHVTPSTCGKILQLSPARIWGMDGIELHSRITLSHHNPNYWWDCVTLIWTTFASQSKLLHRLKNGKGRRYISTSSDILWGGTCVSVIVWQW